MSGIGDFVPMLEAQHSVPVRSPSTPTHGAATETYSALRRTPANVRKPMLRVLVGANRATLLLPSQTTYASLCQPTPSHRYMALRSLGLLAHLASDCKPCGLLVGRKPRVKVPLPVDLGSRRSLRLRPLFSPCAAVLPQSTISRCKHLLQQTTTRFGAPVASHARNRDSSRHGHTATTAQGSRRVASGPPSLLFSAAPPSTCIYLNSSPMSAPPMQQLIRTRSNEALVPVPPRCLVTR